MRLLALGILIVAVIATGAAIVANNSGSSAGAEDAVTLNEILENPQEYAGQTVTVTGEYAENDLFNSADAQVALLIGDDTGERLLVLPQTDDVPAPSAITDNTVLRVTGKVSLAEPAEAGATDPVERGLQLGGVLEETSPNAIIEATRVQASTVGDRPAGEDLAQETTLTRILREPEAFFGNSVVVAGTVARMAENGFLLRSDQAAMFVGVPTTGVEGLSEGDRVRIRAEVSKFSRFRAQTIPTALSQEGERPAESEETTIAERLPLNEDDPYLVFRSLETSGTTTPGAS